MDQQRFVVNLYDLMICSPRRAHGNVKIVPGTDDLDAVYRQILGMRVSQDMQWHVERVGTFEVSIARTLQDSIDQALGKYNNM